MGHRGPPKGTPKAPGSGRIAGTPNKKTQALVDRAKEMGLDIWEAMVEMALESQGQERFGMLIRMAEYSYPKRKAIEHSGEMKKRTVLEIKRPDGSGLKVIEGEDESDR